MDDAALLEAALIGYQSRLAQIDEAIADLTNRLSGKTGSRFTTAPAERRAKRTVSAAARKRMAAAQRRRWAAYRKNKAKQPA